MPEETKLDRLRFLRDAAMTIAAAEFGINGFADAQSNKKPLGKSWSRLLSGGGSP